MKTLKQFWHWAENDCTTQQAFMDKSGKDGPMSEEAQEAMDQAVHVLSLRLSSESLAYHPDLYPHLKSLSFAILSAWEGIPEELKSLPENKPMLPPLEIVWQKGDISEGQGLHQPIKSDWDAICEMTKVLNARLELRQVRVEFNRDPGISGVHLHVLCRDGRHMTMNYDTMKLNVNEVQQDVLNALKRTMTPDPLAPLNFLNEWRVDIKTKHLIVHGHTDSSHTNTGQWLRMAVRRLYDSGVDINTTCSVLTGEHSAFREHIASIAYEHQDSYVAALYVGAEEGRIFCDGRLGSSLSDC